MNEQDYQYLISSYQKKSVDIFTQNIALEAKNNQLLSLVEALTIKVNEQREEIEKLKKQKKIVKAEDNFS